MKIKISKEERKSLICFGIIALLVFLHGFRFTVDNIFVALSTVIMLFVPVLIIRYCPKMWLKPILCLICYVPFTVKYWDDIMLVVLIFLPILILTLMADAVGKNWNENYAVIYMSLSTLILIFDVVWSIINQQTITNAEKEFYWELSYSIGVFIIALMIILIVMSRYLPKNKGNKDSITKFMFVLAIVSCGTDVIDGYFPEIGANCAYYVTMWVMFFAVMDFSEVPQWNMLMEKLRLRK